jgi:prevent-host-death family protein
LAKGEGLGNLNIDHYDYFNYNDYYDHVSRKDGPLMMKIMPAAEAKTNFGALLDAAQREPVTISKKGRPVAVMMSIQDFKAHAALKREVLRTELQKGLKQLERGKSMDGQAFMRKLLEELG